MPLPEGVGTFTLVIDAPPLAEDGSVRQGAFTFTPIPDLLADSEHLYTGVENATLSATGATKTLIANDALDEPFVWRVDGQIDTMPPFSVNISVPASAGTVSLGAVAQFEALPPDYYVVPGPQGPPGTGGGGGGPSPASTVVSNTTFGASGTAGTASTYSRGDHSHGTPAAPTKASVGLGNVDNTADTNKPVSTATQAALDGKADARPWLFDAVKHGGAIGDGAWVIDAVMNASSNTITSATANFPTNVIGRAFILHGASATGDTIVGTITGRTSATQITVSVTAGTSVTGATLLWGTDDTAAFRACVEDGATWAAGHGGMYEVYTPLPPSGSFYMVAGPLVTSLQGNAQIPLPPVADTGPQIVLRWRQEGSSGGPQSWNSLAPNFSGATIVSAGIYPNRAAQAAAVDSGNPCVIGGPAQAHGYGQGGKFSNMVVEFSGTILTTHSKTGLTYGGLDFSSVKAITRDVIVQTTGSVARNDYGAFANFGGDSGGFAIGILMPANGNNDLCIVENVTVGGGYGFGILLTEHCDIYRLCVLYCNGALCLSGNYYGSVGSQHSVSGTLISVESCTYIVQVFGKGSAGVGPTLHLTVDTESSTPRFGDRNGGADIGSARGEVRLGGSFTRSGLILDGPPGFDIIDVNGATVSATANYAINYMDELVLVDPTAASVTTTLPTAVGVPAGKRFTIKLTGALAHPASIAAQPGETIDGAATFPLPTQWMSITVAASGGAWYVV